MDGQARGKGAEGPHWEEHRGRGMTPTAMFLSGSVSRPDFCSQILDSGVRPGCPKTIETNDPDVLRAARHSAESFNNCSNDAFLFKESHVSKALVQVGLGSDSPRRPGLNRPVYLKADHSHKRPSGSGILGHQSGTKAVTGPCTS